ncbi:MAG: tryptophan synthase subunit alpha [Candidatus Omnitrophota bacterium]
MNRIDKKFKELKIGRKKAFVAFITAGDPDLKTTEKLVLEFEKSGVDLIELGVPFSDPLADGPTIQAASFRALKKKVTLKKIFELVRCIRRKSQIPICLMGYYNPVFHFGEEKFIKEASRFGVDGVIIPDLPPEEAGRLISAAQKYNVATIFFLSPTTTKKRAEKVIRASSGFIYYVSLAGVTGTRKALPKTIIKNVRAAKQLTNKPICVGFGVSNPSQVKLIGTIADGVIVGSAIVKEIERNAGKKDLVKNVSRFVKKLAVSL